MGVPSALLLSPGIMPICDRWRNASCGMDTPPRPACMPPPPPPPPRIAPPPIMPAVGRPSGLRPTPNDTAGDGGAEPYPGVPPGEPSLLVEPPKPAGSGMGMDSGSERPPPPWAVCNDCGTGKVGTCIMGRDPPPPPPPPLVGPGAATLPYQPGGAE